MTAVEGKDSALHVHPVDGPVHIGGFQRPESSSMGYPSSSVGIPVLQHVAPVDDWEPCPSGSSRYRRGAEDSMRGNCQVGRFPRVMRRKTTGTENATRPRH
jgi:hypothetical protein